MPEIVINGVVVNFPFEPYNVQRDYMSKVIEALQGSSNAVLESPTGTGKTLCLLCSSLAWLVTKKAQVQAAQKPPMDDKNLIQPANCLNSIKNELIEGLNEASGVSNEAWGVPKIIYASRTHSQLTQAMAEMKRTAYSYMRAAVIGSRDQLCIHPDVVKELGNANKMHLCRAKILAKTCVFYSRVESKKDHRDFRDGGILDIEDLVQKGKQHKCCPFFLSRDLVERADIVFMPYNYLLDPKARKVNKIDLQNSIVILDEAHNVEKMCEESASMQLKSSDLALCIEEVTNIMKKLDEDIKNGFLDEMGSDPDTQATFTLEDLATLKEVLLRLETNIDNLNVSYTEGSTFPGNYIFELLKSAGISEESSDIIRKLLEDLIQYVTTLAQSKATAAHTAGLAVVSDLLTIVFAGKGPEFVERVRRCYKVHIGIEEQKPQKGVKKSDGWTSMSKNTPSVKSNAKVVSFWCFNPGFGMTQVLAKNVRSVILTSGTLAPLKPLISELGIPVNVRLENPHIIKKSQVYVRIVGNGPDNEPLISNYENRNNPKYVSSLGRTILNFCPVIPSGLLVFFPSYFILNKCKEDWTHSGLWAEIANRKPIFIEPRTKEEFVTVMNAYYAKINDPKGKGAIFMAVCRGKVSEGLDFADMNGRGVIITGLPFPPVKDPRVVLKRRYLEENRTRENEILSGNEWYGLEATRAVNQAIGRVIRHKDDYGAILLCDQRFNDKRQKDQLSRWLQSHLQQNPKPGFGTIMKEMSQFFKEAERTLPKPTLKPLMYEEEQPARARDVLANMRSMYENSRVKVETPGSLNEINIENANNVESWSVADYERANIKLNFPQKKQDFLGGLKSESKSIDFNDVSTYQGESGSLVTIHKRTTSPFDENSQERRKKYKLVQNSIQSMHVSDVGSSQVSSTSDLVEVEVKQEVICLDDTDDGTKDEAKSSSGPWSFMRKYTKELYEEDPQKLVEAKPETFYTTKPPKFRSTVTCNRKYELNEIMERANELPADRMDILKGVKGHVELHQYKIFLTGLSDYRTNMDLDLLVARLEKVFDHPRFFHLLVGMRRFVKDPQKPTFDSKVNAFINGKLLKQ